jgi:hypothetical protein
MCKAIFLYVKNADTLPINKLKNYKLSSTWRSGNIRKMAKNNKKSND